jgi:hypothetical protein
VDVAARAVGQGAAGCGGFQRSAPTGGAGEGNAEEGAHGGVQLEFADDFAGANSDRGARALAVSSCKADKQ